MIHRTGPLDCRQFALRILLVQMTRNTVAEKMEGKSKKGKKVSRKERRAAKKEEAHKVGLTGPVRHQIIVHVSRLTYLLYFDQSGVAFKQRAFSTFNHHSRLKNVFSRFCP